MKEKNNVKWLIVVSLLAFVISAIMNLFATIALKSVPLALAIIITLIFVAIGIIFDIIGVAVTSGDEVAFHSMSARKVKGGKIGVKLLKNTEKVSSICCDVIGDVCGIVSGTAGVAIVTIINNISNANELLVATLVASIISTLTIGGKAIGKGIAIKKSKEIVTVISKILAIFQKKV